MSEMDDESMGRYLSTDLAQAQLERLHDSVELQEARRQDLVTEMMAEQDYGRSNELMIAIIDHDQRFGSAKLRLTGRKM